MYCKIFDIKLKFLTSVWYWRYVPFGRSEKVRSLKLKWNIKNTITKLCAKTLVLNFPKPKNFENKKEQNPLKMNLVRFTFEITQKNQNYILLNVKEFKRIEQFPVKWNFENKYQIYLKYFRFCFSLISWHTKCGKKFTGKYLI